MKSLFYPILKILIGLGILTLLILLLAYRGELALEKLIPRYTNENSYFLSINDSNVHVKVSGEGEPVFLIHGSFSSLHTWAEWEKELSNYFLTVSMDLPGHGLTGPDKERRYGTADYAELVFGIADKLGIKEFHVAGNSMGGGVALKMAAEYPERILSLNLIDASGAPAKPTSEIAPTSSRNSGATIFKLARNPLVNKILLKCTPRLLFKWNLKQVYFDHTKITEEMVTRYYELIRREGNRRATLDRLTSGKATEVDFANLKMPVLIMWGAQDRWIPLSSGERFKEAIPGATLKVFENAGHVPMEEIPTETVLEYLHFLGIQPDVDYLSPPNYLSYAH